MNLYISKNKLNQKVAIQFQYTSTNSKVGDSVQVWVVPFNWITQGKQAMDDDSAACMDCPHSKRANKTCYVRKGMAEMGLKSKIASLHSKFLGGEIRFLDASDIAEEETEKCRGKFVRFGAYGEPVLLGEESVRAIVNAASNFTGYTHQWMHEEYAWASRFFMASVENEALSTKAQSKGWRTFRVMSKQDVTSNVEVMCPASKEAGKKVTCNVCGLCKGTSSKAKSISIYKH